MTYLYAKALHIIFVVTWFAGLFYLPRLFIYNTEARDKAEPARSVLHKEFSVMIRRLWLGITWPSALLTLLFGPWVWWTYIRFQLPDWLTIKLLFVAGLYAYHLFLHRIYRQQMAGVFLYTSLQLRVYNEVATVFLVAIVFLATVKSSMSLVWGMVGLAALIAALLAAIRLYKLLRDKKQAG